MNRIFLPAGKSARIFFVSDRFWRGPRANSGKKNIFPGNSPRQKNCFETNNHTLVTPSSHSHHPHHRHISNKLPSSAVVHLRPPLSAAVRRCSPPSTSVSCRLFPRSPLVLPAFACNISAPIFGHLPPPFSLPCTVSLWLPKTVFLF